MKAEEYITLAEAEVGEDKKAADQKIWSATQWLAQLNRGLRDLCGSVPELRLGPDRKLRSVPQAANANADVALDPWFAEAVVQYMAWKFFSRDAGDTKDNQRALAHRGAYWSYTGQGEGAGPQQGGR